MGTATGDEQFCLRWNDFQESILSTLQDLRAEEDFVDVTLVCEGGQQITAHKLILSACSDFFRHLLRRNPAPNPIIVLWDMGADDVRKILRFMYNGEVEVRQAHLNTFLAVAERLRVRGLCQSGGKSPEHGVGGGAASTSSNGGASRRQAGSPPPDASSNPRPGGSGLSSKGSGAGGHSGSSRPDSPRSSRQRRPSLETGGGSGGGSKRPRLRQESEDGTDVSIKEESHQQHGDEGSGGGSIMNRSRGGSEADYAEFGGFHGGDEHGSLQAAALMGMGMPPRGMLESLDPAAAKDPTVTSASAAAAAASYRALPPGLRLYHQRPSANHRFTREQQAYLEEHFAAEQYPNRETRAALAEEMGVREVQVQNWFQNKRARGKHKIV